MGEMAKTSKVNRKQMKRLKETRKEQNMKELKFEENLEIEKAYNKKRKVFIIKTKKEIELEKQKEKANQEELEKRNLFSLFEEKRELEEKFDLMSTVSKQYEDKIEYVAHLDNLK